MGTQKTERKDLAGEHPFTDAGQIVGFFAFAVVWVLDSCVLRISTLWSAAIPSAVTVTIGTTLLGLAFVMAAVSHKVIFVERRDPPEVITKGFFRYVRHPLYLSEILLYVGLSVLSVSLFSLGIVACIFFFLDRAAVFEEKRLEQVFGDRYLDYERNVGRWFPRLPRKKRSRANALL